MTDFPPQLPHGEIEEVLPDVFFVSGQTRPDFQGQIWQFSRNMTVVREGDALTLINTLRLDDVGLATLDALGSVRNIVKLGAFHGRDDAFYLDRYGARMWAVEGMDHERGVTTDVVLTPGQAGPCADVSVFVYKTSDIPEALLLLDREGGVLVACDSLQNWSAADEYFDERSAAAMGESGFFRPANVGPGWRNSANPQAADFARIKALSFRHLLSAHGAPLLDDAHGALCQTFSELFAV